MSSLSGVADSAPIPPSSAVGSSATAMVRLQQELRELMHSSPDGILAFPDNDDIFRWNGTIRGPDESPYHGLEFGISLHFPPTYPYEPPTLQFTSRCYHPNVQLTTGIVCLDILNDQWSAALSVSTVLISVQSLLAAPNNASPLNQEAALVWNDPAEYRVCVMKHLKHGA